MGRRPVLFGLGIGGIVFILVLASLGTVAGSAYTSTSAFCTNCHEMSTRYVSWLRSTHHQIECIDCHSGVGVRGYIQAKVNGVRQMVQHYFGKVGHIQAQVPDPVCMKCHFFSKEATYVYDPMFQDEPLYVPSELHRAHFTDKDSTCTACHQGLVHGSLVKGGIPIDKQVCEDCHRRKKIYVEIEL